MRKTFNFYRSYWDIANELSDKDRLAFYDALLKRQFTGEETELSVLAKFAYISQKHSIDKQIQGFEDKTKTPLQGPTVGGTQGPTQGPSVQLKEKEKEKEKIISIEERKINFANSLRPFLDQYGKDMLNDFYGYWSEHGEKDKKMRFEKEKTFGIEQRLRTWLSRNPDQYKPKENDPNPPEYYKFKKMGLIK